MHQPLAILGLLGLLTTYASATALTYKLAPNERECFYTNVDKKDAKVAFYFAVQSGGSFDSAFHASETERELLTLFSSRLQSHGSQR